MSKVRAVYFVVICVYTVLLFIRMQIGFWNNPE